MTDSARTTLLESNKLWKGYALILGVAGLVYVVSVAPGLLWQDSGMAQTRTLQGDFSGSLGLALSHPLYYLFTLAFQYLPFEESAFKTNLVSAVFGAVTVANVHLLLRLITRSGWAALVGAISVAVAHTFWQHCALAEVYTLSTALLTGELLCWAAYEATRRPAWIAVLFLLNGLGISNHLLALLSLACYLPIVAWLVWRHRLSWRTLAAAAALWLVGASVYLALIIGELMAGGPLSQVLHSAFFGIYQRNVLNLIPGERELRNSILYLGLNFPTPAVILVLFGVAAIWRQRTLPLLAVTVLLLIHLAWAVRYDVPDQYTFFIPAVVLIGICIGLGADWLLARHDMLAWRVVILVGCLIPGFVYIPLPSVTKRFSVDLGLRRSIPYRDEHEYFLHPWKTGYQGAREFAAVLRETLPANIVLLADSTTAAPIHYLELTRGWRVDIVVEPPVAGSGLTRAELESAAQAGRLFVVSPVPRYCPGWILDRYQFEPVGIVFRALPTAATQAL